MNVYVVSETDYDTPFDMDYEEWVQHINAAAGNYVGITTSNCHELESYDNMKDALSDLKSDMSRTLVMGYIQPYTAGLYGSLVLITFTAADFD